MEFPLKETTFDELSLYNKRDSYVKIMDKNRKGKFISNRDIKNPIYAEENKQNLMVSISGYIKPNHATKNNLAMVYMMPIDVDFTLNQQPEEVYQDIINRLTSNGNMPSYIPLPTYIECGHRLRLVWVFSEPYMLITTRKKKLGAIKFIEKVFKAYTDEINSLNPFYNAEPQKLTSFIRPNGSINIKYEEYYQNNERLYRPSFAEEIRYYRCSNIRYTLQELADSILPMTKEEYEPLSKERTHKRTYISLKKKLSVNNHYLQNRLKFLQENQKELEEGHRELLCFHYYNVLLSLGISPRECMERMITYNENFLHPLSLTEVKDARARKIYKYSEYRFYQTFGKDVPNGNNKKESKNIYNRLYMQIKRKKECIKNRKNKIKKIERILKECLLGEKSKKEIASFFKISLKTLYNYLNGWLPSIPT